MTSPYEPPAQSETEQLPRTPSSGLRVIWCWLAVAVIGSLLTTPVDPTSMRMALYFSLACFLGGALFSPPLTVWRVAERVLCAVAFAVAIWLWTLVWQVPPTAMHIPAFLYAGGSVFLGYKASVILPNLYRLLVPLSVAFSMGAFFGPLGSLLLSVPTLMVSRRSAEAQADGEHADNLN